MTQIRECMTACPITINRKQTLKQAAETMQLHGLRHLPVLDGGLLVGLVSDRDVKMVEALPGVDSASVHVDEAMTIDVYTVPPTATLAKVAGTMAEHRYGSAVIVDGEKVVGIFTTVDAMRALARGA